MADFGDHVCRLSVIKYINDHCPHVLLHIWVPDFFLEYAKFCFPKLDIQPYKNKDKYNDKIAGLRGGGHYHTSIKTHLVDHAFHVLVDRQVEIEHKNYVQIDTSKLKVEKKFKLPKKYVVLTSGFTAEVREMLSQTFNELSDYIISKDYVPVYLGNKISSVGFGDNIIGNFKCDYSKGIDLIDQTTLLEAHAIISNAKTIVGLDNGLLHIAGMTQTNIIAGFTTVEPRLRLPYRHNKLGWNCESVIPPNDLKCRFCQSKMTFLFDFDFRKCFYKEIKRENEIQCVKRLASDLYIEKLEKIL